MKSSRNLKHTESAEFRPTLCHLAYIQLSPLQPIMGDHA